MIGTNLRRRNNVPLLCITIRAVCFKFCIDRIFFGFEWIFVETMSENRIFPRVNRDLFLKVDLFREGKSVDSCPIPHPFGLYLQKHFYSLFFSFITSLFFSSMLLRCVRSELYRK